MKRSDETAQLDGAGAKLVICLMTGLGLMLSGCGKSADEGAGEPEAGGRDTAPSEEAGTSPAAVEKEEAAPNAEETEAPAEAGSTSQAAENGTLEALGRRADEGLGKAEKAVDEASREVETVLDTVGEEIKRAAEELERKGPEIEDAVKMELEKAGKRLEEVGDEVRSKLAEEADELSRKLREGEKVGEEGLPAVEGETPTPQTP